MSDPDAHEYFEPEFNSSGSYSERSSLDYGEYLEIYIDEDCDEGIFSSDDEIEGNYIFRIDPNIFD